MCSRFAVKEPFPQKSSTKGDSDQISDCYDTGGASLKAFTFMVNALYVAIAKNLSNAQVDDFQWVAFESVRGTLSEKYYHDAERVRNAH